MPTNIAVDLSGLKGLHIPATPDIFPLAIGWWLVIILLFFFLLCLYFAIYAWFHSLRRQVMQEIKKIEQIKNTKEMLVRINQLAKQLAISRFGREKIAPMYEKEWVTFMNFSAKKDIFSKEYVDLLHKSMYAKKNDISDSMRQFILKDYKEWIRITLNKREKNDAC